MVSVLLSASVERFSVFRMPDFYSWTSKFVGAIWNHLKPKFWNRYFIQNKDRIKKIYIYINCEVRFFGTFYLIVAGHFEEPWQVLFPSRK